MPNEDSIPQNLPMTEEQAREAIELLFFAYRDFTGEPDAILADFGFGRAHHRVVYFVGRHPGMSVSELLAILKITKQSLSRVLSQLIREGFIDQRTDSEDRRRRCLSLTEKGLELERLLTTRQWTRIARAYADAGSEAIGGFTTVLRGIINAEDRERVPAAVGMMPSKSGPKANRVAATVAEAHTEPELP